jgi:cell division cycle protein 20 (cofactor of APC complex)
MCQQALAWCPWQLDLLATGSIYPEGIIRIWNPTSSTHPKPLHSIALNTSVTSLHWSPHCKELLSTHGSTWSLSPTPVAPAGGLIPVTSPIANAVMVYSCASYERIVSVPAHAGPISCSCLSPDGMSVFTVSGWDESIKMWKVWGAGKGIGRRESVFDRYVVR